MCEFIRLNYSKLRFAAFFTWLLFGFLISIGMVFYLTNDKSVTFLWGILITLFYTTITTSLVLAVAVIFGGYEFTRKKKVFGQPQWDSFFSRHDFQTIKLYQHTRWLLTEEVKTGFIKSFPVLADIKRDKAGYVQFMYFIEPASIEKERFKQLKQLLKKYNGAFEVGFLCKRLKRDNKLSEAQIDQELYEFADVLLKEGFIPKGREH